MYATRARGRSLFQQLKAKVENRALLFDVKRLSTRTAEGEIDMKHTCDAAMLDNVARGGNHHGRNAVLFEIARNQTHGLVANGSDRDHYGDIGAVFP